MERFLDIQKVEDITPAKGAREDARVSVSLVERTEAGVVCLGSFQVDLNRQDMEADPAAFLSRLQEEVQGIEAPREAPRLESYLGKKIRI